MALAFVLPVLGACAAAPPRPEYPPIRFQEQAPLRLDVNDVVVDVTYQVPAKPPNVEHLFAVRPAEAARQWAEDRLVAAGPRLRAEYVVRDASVVAVPLKKSTGLTGLVTKDQAERYDARMAVELRIVDAGGRAVATARAEAVRSRSVREDITLNERDQVWYEMTKDIMRELDRQLEQTVRTSLAPYLVP